MKRPCNYPGCPALLDKGTYCPAHAASRPSRHKEYNRHVRDRDPATALAYKIRKSAKWLKVRKQILADFPLCADPFGDHTRAGVTRSSQQVHHIKGIVEHPELWNHRDNLQALCTACHARIERGARKYAATPPEQSSHKPDGTQHDGGECEKFTPFG